MPQSRRRRSRLRRERSATSACASCFEDLVGGPAGFGGARQKVVQLRGQGAQADLLELSRRGYCSESSLSCVRASSS